MEESRAKEAVRDGIPDRAQDSRPKFSGNGPITSKDAEELGIPARSPAPPPETCEFCGATLYHEGLVFPLLGKRPEISFWNPSPQRCTCERAAAYWAEYDAQEERRKQEEEAAENAKRRKQRIERLLGRSGIKKRFRQRTFDRFKADTPERRKWLRVAKEYADRFPEKLDTGEGLYIEGNYGTGKTHLAAAIALQLIEAGVPVVCKTSIDLLMDIKKAFDGRDVSEEAILRAYKDVDLLIIDDLGKEQVTEWSISTLYNILNDRYEDMKPTIITTNFGSDDLIAVETPKGSNESRAEAIVSRLREVSTVLTMVGEDYRSQGGKKC